ncbi:FAD dependent oxidoreductase-domain-containing protein [Crucibulum laeve]|uniref:glycerol-3-phosphate dehydrogenase n=1 Tax=Crucibulum laeve TaxID=68775 RepID=A0A5C3LG93_9AGAR|nr:FAD dependent oxidoreductase-domain-containing protein [Crucibulum laeve]
MRCGRLGYWQVPYYLAGCKMYNVLAGKENMETSYVMSKGKALETFPMLKSDGLVGAVVYYDGQHNDSRMNIVLIMSAAKHGAVATNYCKVTKLNKDGSGKLNGARVKGALTGGEWDVRAKGAINATGPFSDALLTLDDASHKPNVQPSSGIHITLPYYYSPRKMDLLDPITSDGRVIFFLPGKTTLSQALSTPPRVWARGKGKEWCVTETLSLVGRYGWSRNMFIGSIQTYGLEVAKHLSENYGDRAWTVCSLAEPTGESWPLYRTHLTPQYPCMPYVPFPFSVFSLIAKTPLSFSDIEAEVRYAVRHEYALTPIDVLARRTCLSFLNAHAALEALLRVVDIMADEFNWSLKERKKQIKDAVEFLSSMGLAPGYLERMMIPEPEPRGLIEKADVTFWHGLSAVMRAVGLVAPVKEAVSYGPARARFEKGEVAALRLTFEKRMGAADTVQVEDIWGLVKEVPGYASVSRKEYDYVLEEAGFRNRKDMDFEEFVEVFGNLKDVAFAPVASKQKKRLSIPVEKSGRGVYAYFITQLKS